MIVLLFGALGASLLATLFTDSQWGDIQSVLNFFVLLYLTYQGHRLNPRKTVEEFSHNGDAQSQIAETLVDAMEARRKQRGLDTVHHNHRRSTDK